MNGLHLYGYFFCMVMAMAYEKFSDFSLFFNSDFLLRSILHNLVFINQTLVLVHNPVIQVHVDIGR